MGWFIYKSKEKKKRNENQNKYSQRILSLTVSISHTTMLLYTVNNFVHLKLVIVQDIRQEKEESTVYFLFFFFVTIKIALDVIFKKEYFSFNTV